MIHIYHTPSIVRRARPEGNHARQRLKCWQVLGMGRSHISYKPTIVGVLPHILHRTLQTLVSNSTNRATLRVLHSEVNTERACSPTDGSGKTKGLVARSTACERDPLEHEQRPRIMCSSGYPKLHAGQEKQKEEASLEPAVASEKERRECGFQIAEGAPGRGPRHSQAVDSIGPAAVPRSFGPRHLSYQEARHKHAPSCFSGRTSYFDPTIFSNSEDDVNVFASQSAVSVEILRDTPPCTRRKSISADYSNSLGARGGRGLHRSSIYAILTPLDLKNDEMNDEKARQVRILLETVPARYHKAESKERYTKNSKKQQELVSLEDIHGMIVSDYVTGAMDTAVACLSDEESRPHTVTDFTRMRDVLISVFLVTSIRRMMEFSEFRLIEFKVRKAHSRPNEAEPYKYTVQIARHKTAEKGQALVVMTPLQEQALTA
ncbi:hypothetical protein GWK47_043703 [Chionoecetes opilio]|uniref:Uncharacterized protein n=1 Tax=Chionoecetes opilio TaxID=41210 RepID=A0A8J5CJ65_CHIOP|nr:hypothetical protein GWK47_043703 [Chionoecetes opilio]